MSRSFRKTPIMGICGGSDKWNKRKANRKLRRIVKEFLGKDKTFLPKLREVSDEWSFSKDGKQPFDPNKYPKYMRK